MRQFPLARIAVLAGMLLGCRVARAAQPPSCTLNLSAATITTGQSDTLNWTVRYANTSFSISPTVGSISTSGPNSSGSVTVTPTSTTTYTGTAVGNGGTTTCTARVNVVGTLSDTPTSLAFGSVNVGSTSSKTDTLTNTGSPNITVNSVTGPGGPFRISGITTPLTLAGGASTTFMVAYAPTSGSSSAGNVTVSSTAANPSLTVPVSGTGVTTTAPSCSMSANPTSINRGSSSTLSWSTSSAASFTINNGIGAVGLSGSLAVSPASTITYTGTATGASGLTATCSASVTVIQNHYVSLAWVASPSSGVSGYSIYRNSMLLTSVTTLSYTDSAVTAGTSYSYYVTAVNAFGESTASNTASATVPTP